MKNLTIIGHEYMTLKPQGWGMFEIYCKVWEDGKRVKDKDGYFFISTLKVKK